MFFVNIKELVFGFQMTPNILAQYFFFILKSLSAFPKKHNTHFFENARSNLTSVGADTFFIIIMAKNYIRVSSETLSTNVQIKREHITSKTNTPEAKNEQKYKESRRAEGKRGDRYRIVPRCPWCLSVISLMIHHVSCRMSDDTSCKLSYV